MTTSTPISPEERSAKGASIRQRREALGIGRVALASRAGCSPSHVANIESGYIPSRGEALARIEAALTDLEREHATRAAE